MPSRVEKLNQFYSKAFSNIGFFSIAPLQCVRQEQELMYDVTVLCCCMPLVFLIASEACTLSLALLAIAPLALSAPFTYAGAAAIDSCTSPAVRPRRRDIEEGVLNHSNNVYIEHRLSPAQQALLSPMEQSDYFSNEIWEFFYEGMIEQGRDCLLRNWLNINLIEEQDPAIYFLLPALVILQILANSLNCDDLVLPDRRIITAENCPEDHLLLLGIRQSIPQLTQEHIDTLRSKFVELGGYSMNDSLCDSDETIIKNLYFSVYFIVSDLAQTPNFKKYMPNILAAIANYDDSEERRAMLQVF